MRATLICALPLLCLCCGCVTESREGAESAFRIEAWIWIVAGIIGLAAAPLSLLLRGRRPVVKLAVALVGFLFVLFVVPSLALDRTIVDDRHFETKHGFWFSPSVYSEDFARLRAIRVEMTEKWTRRGTRRDYTLECQRKDGTTQRVPLGDVMKRAAPEILGRARRQGVLVQGEAELP